MNLFWTVFPGWAWKNQRNPKTPVANLNARNKKRLLIASTAVAALAAAILIHWLANHGPSYEGKDISYWFNHQVGFSAAYAAQSPEGEAFRAMGPAAVPYLTKMLRQDTRWEEFYWTLCFKHGKQFPLWVQKVLPHSAHPMLKKTWAADLLEMLGTSAKAAAPDLIKSYKAAYAKDYNSPAKVIAGAGAIGSRSWNGVLREKVIRALAAVGGDDPKIVPVLLIAMIEPDDRVQGEAHRALQNINVIAAVKKCAPDLVEALDNPQAKMRYSAAALLGLAVTERHEAILPLVRA
jgi:hypothetical protein